MLITFEQTILSCRFSGITISPYQVFLGVDHLIFEGGGGGISSPGISLQVIFFPRNHSAGHFFLKLPIPPLKSQMVSPLSNTAQQLQ